MWQSDGEGRCYPEVQGRRRMQYGSPMGEVGLGGEIHGGFLEEEAWLSSALQQAGRPGLQASPDTFVSSHHAFAGQSGQPPVGPDLQCVPPGGSLWDSFGQHDGGLARAQAAGGGAEGDGKCGPDSQEGRGGGGRRPGGHPVHAADSWVPHVLSRLPTPSPGGYAEQSGSPRAGMGSDQEDSKPITLDTTDFQESFVTSGVFSVTELIQVSRTPVVTGTGPNFSLGELQGHLAYDLNPASTGMRRTLPSTSSSGSKRHKSGSMEEDVDTSPGGDYYTSPSSPTSSSRNWTEDMEGGISSPVKKTEMDKSPFNSPSPQDSPRLSSFTQHHRPVIAVHSGIARSPHPSSALHFPTTSILPQTASTYFPHTAIRYPPHLNPQDPLKDLVSLACDPASQQPGPLNGSGQLRMFNHCLSTQMLAPPPPGLPRLAIPPATKPTTTSEGGATSPTSPTYSTPDTSPANRSFVGLGPRDPAGIYQAQSWYLG
ncbi:PREDICTED: nuclear factor 1 C-type [Galeopterus variegatus]|uniref:Nuclear factor 1 C-type n=1 Tax=Galeopterus variegatus TaxID=482537 RepID=A0ABM0RTR1_GALVR|nr:PREDICTED: nuclear factor 1 C-type [Galeopterus variegatus]